MDFHIRRVTVQFLLVSPYFCSKSIYRLFSPKIALLHYELKHPANISPDGVITAMSYDHGDSTSRRLGHISNKTLYIALNYQEQADKLNTGTVDEIARQLMDLERVQAQLDYCISLLDNRQKQVILALYIEGLKMKEIEQRLEYSAKTVRKLRDEAIDTLTGLYNLLAEKR